MVVPGTYCTDVDRSKAPIRRDVVIAIIDIPFGRVAAAAAASA